MRDMREWFGICFIWYAIAAVNIFQVAMGSRALFDIWAIPVTLIVASYCFYKGITMKKEQNRMTISRILNLDEGKYGVCFGICEKHWEQMKARLSRRAPQCILEKIAVVKYEYTHPIPNELTSCDNCDRGEDIPYEEDFTDEYASLNEH